MVPSILLLALLLGQAPDRQSSEGKEAVGKIETFNKATGCIGVRDIEKGNRRLYYVLKSTQITKDGGDTKSLKDLRVGDVVAMTWVMKHEYDEDKRIVQTLNILPTVWPDKFKVGQVGYLPPQGEKYYFVVEAISNNQTVLVREILLEPKQIYQELHQGVPGYAGTLKVKVPDHLEFVKKLGEQFFLGQVNAADYPVGRKVQLDGKWRVKSANSTEVTQVGPRITTKESGSKTTEEDQDTRVKKSGQGEEEVTVNGNPTQTNVKGSRKGETNVNQNTTTKGTSTRTSQNEMTTKVSGYLLVPEKSE